MPLDDLLVKNLLQDIEASGKTRREFNLPKLLEEKRHTYGEAGSDKRRDVQKKFDLLKRKTPLQYQKVLDKKGVNSGEALQREIRSLESESSGSEGTSGSGRQ